MTGETELGSYSSIDLNKGVTNVERSTFEEEKLELDRLREDLLAQKKELSEQIAQSGSKRDALLVEKAELVNRQLLPGDIGDVPTRQMLLRALLDENRIEKERKKRGTETAQIVTG